MKNKRYYPPLSKEERQRLDARFEEMSKEIKAKAQERIKGRLEIINRKVYGERKMMIWLQNLFSCFYKHERRDNGQIASNDSGASSQ